MSDNCPKPGTMEAIFKAMCDFAISDLGHSAHSSRHPFTTIRRWIANAKAQLSEKDAQLAAESKRADEAERRNAELFAGLKARDGVAGDLLERLAASEARIELMSTHLKVEKLRLIEVILDEAQIAHRKCGNVITTEENFQLGRHGGLMWAYRAVCHAALLSAGEEAKDAK